MFDNCSIDVRGLPVGPGGPPVSFRGSLLVLFETISVAEPLYGVSGAAELPQEKDVIIESASRSPPGPVQTNKVRTKEAHKQTPADTWLRLHGSENVARHGVPVQRLAHTATVNITARIQNYQTYCHSGSRAGFSSGLEVEITPRSDGPTC